MNEEEERMCAVGKNPVFTCPWAKARGQACFGLPLGQGQGPVYCASASSPQDFWDDDEDVFMQLMMRMYMQLCVSSHFSPHN